MLRFDPRYDPAPTLTELEDAFSRVQELGASVKYMGLSEVPTNPKISKAYHQWIAAWLDVFETVVHMELPTAHFQSFQEHTLRTMIQLRDDIEKISTFDDQQKGFAAEALKRVGLKPGFTHEERQQHDGAQLRLVFLMSDLEKKIGWPRSWWIKIKASF